MKKGVLITICCALPLAVIGLLLIFGGERVDHSSMPGENKPQEKAFPAFNLIDINSFSITNETLKGKPTILWFTTTWCTPCQVGAKKVTDLNKKLGGALNILAFFVDPRESKDDLKDWRNKYANADWRLAFNNGLAEKIGIQFLDSKYLLDKDGVIRDFNTRIVNDQYLTLLESLVEEGR